ncbi:MAG: type I restriction enzyme HsdR N-terminal domain-containing protein [Prevotellaceae bacterium]|nr:type I restriction enzyme HsdR N-terminal domain-containing protein [Prevotellaceae bacterium]
MQELNLPKYEIRIGRKDGRLTIFDFLRRRYVALTPEEWVRQHFTHFLVEHKSYPQGLLANEVELSVGDKSLRCDSVLYDRELRPRMIVEYKAPHIKLTQKVFQQIATYNLLLHVDYLVVSNGIEHHCVKMDYENEKYLFLEDIPEYKNL